MSIEGSIWTSIGRDHRLRKPMHSVMNFLKIPSPTKRNILLTSLLRINGNTCGGPHIYGGGACGEATAEFIYGGTANRGP